MFHICDTIVNCIVFIIVISNFGSKDIKYNLFLYTDLKPANLLNSCVNSNGFIDSVRLYIEDHVTGKKKKKWQFYIFLSNLDVFCFFFLPYSIG